MSIPLFRPRRWLVGVFVGSLLIAGCGAAPAPAARVAVPPTAAARIVTREVTRVVQVTREVVVTATPLPATATPAEPTATLAPTGAPTATPDPRIQAQTTRATPLYDLPDAQYNELAQLAAGATVTVLYRGAQWYQVETNGVTGWLYRDWLAIPADRVESVAIYPDAQPVLVGKVVQEFLGEYVVFKGRVLNIGLAPAQFVKIDIELFDAGKNRVGIDSGYVDTPEFTLAGGEEGSFQVMSRDVRTWETYMSHIIWQ